MILVTLSDVVEINPRTTLKKGVFLKCAPMSSLEPYRRSITGFLIEEYKGGVKFRQGDTLMARITPSLENGKTALVDFLQSDEVGFGSTEFIVLRSIPGVTDSKYVYYLTVSPSLREVAIKSMTGTSGRQRVQTDVVKNYSFFLPTLLEQKAIAEVLSSLDDKIELLQKQNETLEALAQTLFRQWFIEEAYDVDYLRLGDLVEIIDNRGKTPPWQQEETEYPLIEVNALGERVVDYTKIRKYVDKPTFESWFRGHPSKYATLLSTVGSIGEFSMYLLERGTIAQNVIALEAQGLSKFYLYQVMCYLQKEIKEFNIGSVQPSIKVSHLKNYKIPIPKNKQAISHFDEFSKSICDKMENNQIQIQTLQHTRDTLLPKLMSGQVRVKLD